MWKPPDECDPSEILNEAVADGRAGRNEDALAKFLWFHSHAVQIEPGLSGVRVSFALAYWLNLAEDYPPAREAFIRVRDETERALGEDPGNFSLFQDVVCMNARLDEGIRSADLFESIAASNRDAATRIYRLAERELIRAGRFKVCNAFLEPESRMSLASRCHQATKRFSEANSIQHAENFDRKYYEINVATLIGLLVINGRTEEALLARERALEDLDDPEFRTTLEAGLTGHLPEQHF